MPTYEYKREDGTTFEIMQGINEEPLKKCPDTGQKVTRVISGGGGVVYRGDGFYITDYKNNGPKNGDAGQAQNSETDTGEASNADAD
ncbi:MAG: zinc ribbon domain-containing protein [Balneolaceae bacterium]|nr:zinc ribbon domain-containing protein [Balneolaceae bacterium]